MSLTATTAAKTFIALARKALRAAGRSDSMREIAEIVDVDRNQVSRANAGGSIAYGQIFRWMDAWNAEGTLGEFRYRREGFTQQLVLVLSSGSVTSDEPSSEVRKGAAQRVEQLEAAIRKHRAATGHQMCHENDEELWHALGDGVEIDHTPPPWCEFMQRCAEYRASKDLR